MTAHELANALLLRPDVPVVVIGYGHAVAVTHAALADGRRAVVLYVEAPPEPPAFALEAQEA